MKVSTYKHLYEMEILKHKQMASPRALRPFNVESGYAAQVNLLILEPILPNFVSNPIPFSPFTLIYATYSSQSLHNPQTVAFSLLSELIKMTILG
jgi:hypothetical protein